jgi:hypothetical protein
MFTPQTAKQKLERRLPKTNKLVKELKRRIQWYINNGYSNPTLANLYTTKYGNVVIKQAILLLREEGWNISEKKGTIEVDLLNPLSENLGN